MLVISSGLPVAAQTAFVRVNQVGYVGGGSKRAYLMSSGMESGATFSVKNSSGGSVLTAPIGANLGSWSRTYPNVYALDFSRLPSGIYTITVSWADWRRLPRVSESTRPRTCSHAAGQFASYHQNSARWSELLASPLRTAAAHVNDGKRAKVYLTPNYNAGFGPLFRRSDPHWATSMLRRLVGRRRLSQIRQTQQLHGA